MVKEGKAENEAEAEGDAKGVEKRKDTDGNAYTYDEFVAHYGESKGAKKWDKALTSTVADEVEVFHNEHEDAFERRRRHLGPLL